MYECFREESPNHALSEFVDWVALGLQTPMCWVPLGLVGEPLLRLFG